MSKLSPIPGPKVILLGDSGTGKTYAIRTLLDAGLTPFIIFTEPGMESIGDVLDRCHYTYIPPAQGSWDNLLKIGDMVSKLAFDAVAKMQDANKSKYDEFLRIIKSCNNFVDQNGKEWGDVMDFGTDKVLVIDSLSGLNDMASNLVVGGKSVKGLQDWQVAQNMLKKLIDKLCTGCRCSMILMSHIAREQDEITGATRLFVSTLGKALAPDLPAYFSDVIQTTRTGDQFHWDTSGSNIAVKGRNVPYAAKQPASFVPLFKRWQERGGIIESSDANSPQEAANPS